MLVSACRTRVGKLSPSKKTAIDLGTAFESIHGVCSRFRLMPPYGLCSYSSNLSNTCQAGFRDTSTAHCWAYFSFDGGSYEIIAWCTAFLSWGSYAD